MPLPYSYALLQLLTNMLNSDFSVSLTLPEAIVSRPSPGVPNAWTYTPMMGSLTM